MAKAVTIFGAGISGLVAAINLARSGFRVELVEKYKAIGGPPGWHPSVQFTTCNTQALSRSIGIDITPCFQEVKFQKRYLYRKKTEFKPVRCYLCEKGSRSSSVESFLYGIARSLDIQFHWGIEKPLKEIYGSENAIVATGLEIDTYRALQIPYTPIAGYRALLSDNHNFTYIDFYNSFTNYDLAYLAGINDITFILLFSRKGLYGIHADRFRVFLQDHEHIQTPHWIYSEGCVPAEAHLTWNGLVLAGTISGMIDPFFLNGLPGAFLSGKIAADYLTNKEYAEKTFRSLTRTFTAKKALKSCYQAMPFKQYFFPAFCLLESKIKSVGFP